MGSDAMDEETQYRRHGVFATVPDTSSEKSGTQTCRTGVVDYTGAAGAGMAAASGNSADSQDVQRQARRGKPQGMGYRA